MDAVRITTAMMDRLTEMKKVQWEKIDRGLDDEGPNTRKYAQIRLEVLDQVFKALDEEFWKERDKSIYWEEQMTMKRK